MLPRCQSTQSLKIDLYLSSNYAPKRKGKKAEVITQFMTNQLTDRLTKT